MKNATGDVVQDSDGEVVGVASDQRHIKIGGVKGLQISKFELNGMPKIGHHDRPWVVYFKGGDQDRLSVWPVSELPEESGPVVQSDGIEFVVYAINAREAVDRVFGRLRSDSWDIAVSEWESLL